MAMTITRLAVAACPGLRDGEVIATYRDPEASEARPSIEAIGVWQY
jgi:hypothetical protein